MIVSSFVKINKIMCSNHLCCLQKKLLVQCGGKDVSRGVRKMMESVVTYEVACDYTLLGRKRCRKNFSSLRLCRVIRRKQRFFLLTTYWIY